MSISFYWWSVGTVVIVAIYLVRRYYKVQEADRKVGEASSDPIVTEADSRTTSKEKSAKLVGKKTIRWGYILGGVATLAAIVLIAYAVVSHNNRISKMTITRDELELNRLKTELELVRSGRKKWTVVVRKNAPQLVPISLGDSIFFQRQDSVAFKVVLSSGREVTVPLGITSLVEMPPSTRSMNFILPLDSPADSVRIEIRKWRAKWG